MTVRRERARCFRPPVRVEPNGNGLYDPEPALARAGREFLMGLGRRGAFRNETRTTRMERLHGPKVARPAERVPLSEEEKEKRRVEALADRERYRQERSLRDRSPGE